MNKKEEEIYEKQVLEEFESTQKDEETVKKIGKVDLTNKIDINEDPDIKRINNTIGYINIPLDTLPSRGKFYPENTRISIRAARVGEIREFSIVDEEDPKDIRDKMVYILSQCIKVYYGDTPGSYKDILDDDRIILILKVRELTFIDGQSSIKIPVPVDACNTPGCHPQEFVYLDSSKIEFLEPNDKIEKYYDHSERCYNIQTKRFGSIKLYLPTIGVNNIVTEWIRKQQEDRKKIDVALVDILPYLIPDWKGFSERQIFAKLTELAGWSTEKFSLVLRLKDEINVGIKFEITEQCAQCGGELKVPIIFPEGFRSIFVPTISDLGDELL